MRIDINITNKAVYTLLAILLILLLCTVSFAATTWSDTLHYAEDINVNFYDEDKTLQQAVTQHIQAYNNLYASKATSISLEKKTLKKRISEDDTTASEPCPTGFVRSGCDCDGSNGECESYPDKDGDKEVCKGLDDDSDAWLYINCIGLKVQ